MHTQAEFLSRFLRPTFDAFPAVAAEIYALIMYDTGFHAAPDELADDAISAAHGLRLTTWPPSLPAAILSCHARSFGSQKSIAGHVAIFADYVRRHYVMRHEP